MRSVWLDRVFSMVMATIVTIAFAGCSTGPEPSALETPNVVWPLGTPTGPFETTEAVKALRAKQLAEAVAWNAMDFSDPSFVAFVGVQRASGFAETSLSWHNRFAHTGEERFAREAVMLGPEPTIILDVIDQGDGIVSLVVCTESRLGNSGRRVWHWIVTSRSDGGFWVEVPPKYIQPTEAYEAECDAATIPIANFDPVPGPVLDPEAKVIGPADKSKYNFD